MLTGDVVVVEALNASTMKAKLFQFSENYRPAYYGTWQKQSQLISGRRPFAKDTNHLDYEVDSDDEWEEVEPGESLSHSEVEITLVLCSVPSKLCAVACAQVVRRVHTKYLECT